MKFIATHLPRLEKRKKQQIGHKYNVILAQVFQYTTHTNIFFLRNSVIQQHPFASVSLVIVWSSRIGITSPLYDVLDHTTHIFSVGK